MSQEVKEKTQTAINQEIHAALFGINGEKGLVQKMDNVDEILSAFRLFGKAIMWIALLLGSIGTAFAGVIEAIKFFFHRAK